MRKEMEKLELLCVVGETVHGAATRENNLVVLQTITNRITV